MNFKSPVSRYTPLMRQWKKQISVVSEILAWWGRYNCREPNLLQMTYVLKEKFRQHTDKRLKALCCCCCSSSLFIWHATQCTTLQVRAQDRDRGGGREEVERVEGKRCDNQRMKRDTSAETRTCCLGVLLERTKSPPPRHIWMPTGDSSLKN